MKYSLSKRNREVEGDLRERAYGELGGGPEIK